MNKIILFILLFLTVTNSNAQENTWTLEQCIALGLENSFEVKIKQIEIEIEGIKRENDAPKLEHLSKILAEFKADRDNLRAKWQSEKNVVDNIQNEKRTIEQLKITAEQLERNGEYGKVAEIRYGKIKDAENKIEALQVQLSQINAGSRMIKEDIAAEDIA